MKKRWKILSAFLGMFCVVDSLYAYTFSEIKLENEPSPPSEVKAIFSSYKGKDLSKEELVKLTNQVTNVYIKNGYITSFVNIKEGNPEKGVLLLELKRGIIEKVLSEKSYNLSFPAKEGKILNICDIDQLIENVNGKSVELKVNVLASEKVGRSNIEIKEKRLKEFVGTISLDNNNYKDYGRENISFSLGRASTFFAGDFVNFYIKERITKKIKNHRESLYKFSYSLPIGYSKLEYSFSKKKNSDVISTGKYRNKRMENIHNLNFSRVLSRNKKNKFEVYSNINFKATKNYFDYIKLDVSSKKYTTLGMGFKNLLFIKNGYVLSDFKIEKGVRLFGGAGNEKNNNIKASFDKEFLKLIFSSSFNKNFFFTKYGYLNYSGDLYSVYSKSHLLDQNKFEMGGIDSVRGFKESTIKGDKGAYVLNTLTWEGNLLKPFLGFDFGISRDRYRKNSDKIVGCALGLSYENAYLSARLTLSKTIKRAEDMSKESLPIYFKVSYNF